MFGLKLKHFIISELETIKYVYFLLWSKTFFDDSIATIEIDMSQYKRLYSPCLGALFKDRRFKKIFDDYELWTLPCAMNPPVIPFCEKERQINIGN